MRHDVVLRGGSVIDGSGAPAFRADVAIRDGRIAAIGRVEDADAGEVVDATGHVVAPGFIDVHTHDDSALLSPTGMVAKTSQGVTTVIVGNCGISVAPLELDETPPAPLTLVGGRENFRFATFADYLGALEAEGIMTNAAALVGHTTLRRRCMPTLERAANAQETAEMAREVAIAVEAGAIGVSTGLDYIAALPSSTEEVKALSRAAAELGGLYVTHTRNYFEHLEEAIEEAIEIASDTAAKLVISHHQATGRDNFGKAAPTLSRIDEARRNMEIGVDCYPYAASSTVLKTQRCDKGVPILITWSDPHPELANHYLADIARDWACTEAEAAERLLPAGAVYFQLDEADVRTVLSHPRTMIGSDGLPHDDHPHPRLWGTFPRVLGHYARDLKLFSLERAVHQMTGLPAGEFGLRERGLLRAGFHADIVVFDPETVIDRATYEKPAQPSQGIERVLVNGRTVWAGGAATGLRPGRVLRRARDVSVHLAGARRGCAC
ncbi:D-aminoacylase [Aureimonas flava]|uniref:D-aminoacylase n=1 Tax=Aureimonas flava TaxID=2320271 RepID=A0A3A1WQE0_9HYPH|nr:D-aminoacylase [Aureimonas flava]RIY02564.1 D-aminoacylase [Aureimonas flava]